MRMPVIERERNSIDEASFHLLDVLKKLLTKWFGAGVSSQDKALNLLQSSKGFDPVKSPQSLLFPKVLSKERTADRRLPIRKAA